MSDYRLVDLNDDDTIDVVSNANRIGVDTEFMRERTFFAELCLLQISTQSEIVLIDPLVQQPSSDKVIATFWETVVKPEWVLHSGRQDLEVVSQTSGKLPRAIFDTQIAAALLGYQPQMGYASLVRELFGVDLDKSHTRANWTRRPLVEALLDYAAEDVQYLLPAYEELVRRLDKMGRLEWANQDSSDLLDPSLYESDPTLAIDRLKGARNLRGPARAAANHLAAWRERQALQRNRPRQWILRDAVLIEIAVSAPKTIAELSTIDGMPERTIRRRGNDILKTIVDASRDITGYQPPERPSEAHKMLLKEMQKQVSAVAEDLGIATEVLAPKKELSAAMLGNRQSRVFSGWRHELIGGRLSELVQNA